MPNDPTDMRMPHIPPGGEQCVTHQVDFTRIAKFHLLLLKNLHIFYFYVNAPVTCLNISKLHH